MQRPGKNQRRRARERANTASAIDRLNSAIKTQQKERIHKPEQHKQTVCNVKSRASIVGEMLALVNLPLELCGASLRSYRALNAHTSPQRLL
jgi:hypothetical protein